MLSTQYLIIFNFLNFQFHEPLGYSSMLYDERKNKRYSYNWASSKCSLFRPNVYVAVTTIFMTQFG